MTSSRCIPVFEESQVGFARRRLVEICQRSGGDEAFCGKVAIVVTEMARNLVLHGKGGEIVIREAVTATSRALEMLALDRGPGMRNIAECLRAMVVDGLGHGLYAGEAAREAVAVFRSQATTGVASTLKLVDQALTKTRGAAGQLWSFVQRKDTLQQPALATSRCAS